MSEQSNRSGLISGRRPSFLRYATKLYFTDSVVTGLVDFAVIGTIVLLFMHPPSLDWRKLWAFAQPAQVSSAVQQPAPPHASSEPPAAVPSSTPAEPSPSAAPAAGSAATTAPAPTTAPPHAVKASTGIGLPDLESVRRPRLMSYLVIDIDQEAFRSSTASDRERLKKAVADYKGNHFEEMLDDLAGADSVDPNVVFLRGIAGWYGSDSLRYSRVANQLRAAFDAGQKQAGILLGVLLVAAPEGVTKDMQEGVRLIEAGASAGDRMAQRLAGIGYLGGEFGIVDPPKAAAFLQKAVDAGDFPAMLVYARMFDQGLSVDKDEGRAEELVRRAASGGLSMAKAVMGDWIVERYIAGVVQDPSEGLHFLESAYRDGFSITSLNRLAVFYVDYGRGKWKDVKKGFELTRLCAAFANLGCQFAFATHLHFGKEVAVDLPRAYVHYELARMLGSTRASERMKVLDSRISPAEKEAALAKARDLRGSLKSTPQLLLLQDQNAPPPPSPWDVTPAPASLR